MNAINQKSKGLKAESLEVKSLKLKRVKSHADEPTSSIHCAMLSHTQGKKINPQLWQKPLQQARCRLLSSE